VQYCKSLRKSEDLVICHQVLAKGGSIAKVNCFAYRARHLRQGGAEEVRKECYQGITGPADLEGLVRGGPEAFRSLPVDQLNSTRAVFDWLIRKAARSSSRGGIDSCIGLPIATPRTVDQRVSSTPTKLKRLPMATPRIFDQRVSSTPPKLKRRSGERPGRPLKQFAAAADSPKPGGLSRATLEPSAMSSATPCRSLLLPPPGGHQLHEEPVDQPSCLLSWLDTASRLDQVSRKRRRSKKRHMAR